jgi:hypothetical protein
VLLVPDALSVMNPEITIESMNFSTSPSSSDDGSAELLGTDRQSMRADVERIAEASICLTEEGLSIWRTGDFKDVFDVDCGMSEIIDENDPGTPEDNQNCEHCTNVAQDTGIRSAHGKEQRCGRKEEPTN